jgi:SAM-dependent methyltransferase
MASSFHWVDFNKGTQEFARVLREGGRFGALWNPRFIEANPLLVEIENKLYELAPNIKRVSSGRSGITETLAEQLENSPLFDDVIYLEGRHVSKQTPEHYLGVWWSVNDIRVQAGEENFQTFMAFVEKRVAGLDFIETTYLTRAWSARKA